MQEMQQHLGITRHRAGNIANRDQGRRPHHPAAPGNGHNLATRAQRTPQGRPQIHPRAIGIRPVAPGAPGIQRQPQLANLGPGIGDLSRTHRLEIHRLQPLTLTDRHRHIEQRRRFLHLLGRRRRAVPRHGLGQAPAAGALLLLRLETIEHRHRGGVPAGLRITPEDVEGGVEDFGMLVAMHHHRPQTGLHLPPLANINARQGLRRGHHLSRAQRQARPAQQPREGQKIGRQRRHARRSLAITTLAPQRVMPRRGPRPPVLQPRRRGVWRCHPGISTARPGFHPPPWVPVHWHRAP